MSTDQKTPQGSIQPDCSDANVSDEQRMDWLELNVRTNSDNLAKWNLDTFWAESLRGRIDELMANGNATKANGLCIVCGSALLIQFWRGHPDNRKVHCNNCGSEVTQYMHDKKQPNDRADSPTEKPL